MTRLQPLFYLAAIGCLYLNAFILPHTPIYEGDTAPIYLLEATKMLEGQVIYRDFFQFTLPGTQVFYLLLFKLFGVRAWIPSLVWVVLGIGLAWTCVVISKQVLSGASVYLPSLLFLGLAFFSEPDPNHHWFSILACMAALAVLMPKRSLSRWAAAGALCGLSTLFTQSRGIVAIVGFAAFLLWECRTKKQGWGWLVKAGMYLVIPFLATTLPVMAYLAWKVGASLFFNCTVVFLMKYWSKWFWGTIHVYGADLPIDLPLGLEVGALLMWIFIHLLVPFVYILFYAQYRRRAIAHPEEPWDRVMLICIVGLFLFLGIALSPVWFRLISVALPALILYAWLVKAPAKLPRALTRLAWAGGVLALVSQPAVVQTGWKGYIDPPTGRAALLDPDRYEKYRWLLAHTHPGDFFFQADDCDEYFLLGLRNPAEVSFVTDSIYTRPEQVQNAVDMIEKHRVRFVMWSAWLDVPRSPGGDGSAESPLRAYLRIQYHPVRGFDDQLEEAWERNQ
ncbi:MAG: hypothetical protein ABSA59_24715 [Terriglobia bacterium]